MILKKIHTEKNEQKKEELCDGYKSKMKRESAQKNNNNNKGKKCIKRNKFTNRESKYTIHTHTTRDSICILNGI